MDPMGIKLQKQLNNKSIIYNYITEKEKKTSNQNK